ncbi:MAG TPA: hypothetical protein PLP50_02940 [Thermoanaerobaculia bacterium]|nr:hypothetical protein [Thermoanaerobaculia bacterium]HQN06322.1 hypothetical protein [Thermoanaerobaculia bacterium]HQP85218.1 hypothetical protein [Thermoanaerobaculia bacterium]
MKNVLARTAIAASVFLCLGSPRSAFAQDDPQVLEGEAAFKHPSTQVVLKAAEHFRAGKIDAGMALYTASEQADWKKSSEKAELSARRKERAPDPKAFAEGIRKGGTLTLYATEGQLRAPLPNRAMGIAYLALENGTWRLTGGPMAIENAQDPAKEERFHGDEMRAHPVYALALKYAEMLHAKKDDSFMQLATKRAREKWAAEPASERSESAAYRRRTIPKKADLAASLKDGGFIVVEDDVRASLVLVSVTQSSPEPGTVSSTSSTLSLGFELEDGEWRVAN